MPRSLLIAAIVVALPFATLQSQRPGSISLGAHVSFNFDDVESVGAHALVGIVPRLSFYPSATSFLVSSGSSWLVTGAMRFSILQRGPVRPYVGAGPSWIQVADAGTSVSKWGFVGLGGVEFPVGSTVLPFVEVRILTDVPSDVTGGLRLTLRGSSDAQQAAGAQSGRSPTSLYVAGGIEFAKVTGSPTPYATFDGPGLSLQAGYARQFERWGFRLGLAYFDRELHYPDDRYTTNARNIGPHFDLTYDFTRSRIRPYLIGGLFPHWGQLTDRYSDGRTFTFSNLSLGYSAGFGLRMPVRHADVFVDYRRYFGSGWVYSPLTLGVRF